MMAAVDRATCRRTRIKLCGMTSTDEVEMAVSAGVDALGLVFSAGSPRCVLPHTAMQIAKRIPPFVSVVGVFSNPSDPDLMAWSGRWVQLMGHEDEPQIQRVARLRSIIKGFPCDAAQLRRWDRCAAVGAMLVQMPAGASAKGVGSALIDELADAAHAIHTPIILGGAIAPETIGTWVQTVRPHGVDIGGEATERGPSFLRDIVAAVREGDAS
jgi:phosphoribosylanthranilate isomerase